MKYGFFSLFLGLINDFVLEKLIDRYGYPHLHMQSPPYPLEYNAIVDLSGKSLPSTSNAHCDTQIHVDTDRGRIIGQRSRDAQPCIFKVTSL